MGRRCGRAGGAQAELLRLVFRVEVEVCPDPPAAGTPRGRGADRGVHHRAGGGASDPGASRPARGGPAGRAVGGRGGGPAGERPGAFLDGEVRSDRRTLDCAVWKFLSLPIEVIAPQLKRLSPTRLSPRGAPCFSGRARTRADRKGRGFGSISAAGGDRPRSLRRSSAARKAGSVEAHPWSLEP
jgi:hypothetical protein